MLALRFMVAIAGAVLLAFAHLIATLPGPSSPLSVFAMLASLLVGLLAIFGALAAPSR